MDRFELAERRYRDIADENLPGMDRGTRYWRMPAARLRAWIDEYVLPAVEEVCDRPQFRDHATWPQRVLVRGADTPERAAVERVDRALVAEAKALRKLSRNRLVARALEEMTPRQEESATGSVTISSGGAGWVPLRLDPRRNRELIGRADVLSRIGAGTGKHGKCSGSWQPTRGSPCRSTTLISMESTCPIRRCTTVGLG